MSSHAFQSVFSTSRLAIVVAIASVSAPLSLAGDCLTAAFDAPAADRWNYPFNTTPGTKPDAKVFGAYTETGFSPDFDNRDGQMIIGFDTGDQVLTGLPLDQYDVLRATVTIMVESEDTFAYDSTVDAWASYLLEDHPLFESDDDAGRPVELFGVGFRNGLTSLTWQENTPYSTSGGFGKDVRTAWPLAFDETGAPFDVSNNIDEQIDPAPFAVGMADGFVNGDIVPQLTTLTFEIDVSGPAVQQYLRHAVRDGRAFFAIASIFPAAQQVGGSFPEFFTKESAAVDFDLADAATLTLEVRTGRPGDLDGNGVVDVADLLGLLAAWGACPPAGNCPADTNCDDVVNVTDLLNLLADWD